MLARALDAWWDGLRRPDPFVVVEAGAGRGTLARAVLAAEPVCSPALRYVLVERSAALRAEHAAHLPLEQPAFAFAPRHEAGHRPVAVSLPDLPRVAARGVLLANELLDNLPFRLLELAVVGWREVRAGLDGDDGPLCEYLVPAEQPDAYLAERLAPDAPVGARIPLQHASAAWLRQALSLFERGHVAIIDYASTTPLLAARPWTDWLRTYRAHARGGALLTDLGEQDITCEVASDQLARVGAPDRDRSQADFLAAHGIEALVDEGRAAWAAGSARGDLAAVRGRSRVREAEALTDPAGLGAFRVLEWDCGT